MYTSLHIQQQASHYQQLTMTPRMQKAFHALQLPIIELNQWLKEEIEKNPILTMPSSSISTHDLLNTCIPSPKTLYQHLIEYIPMHFDSLKDQQIAQEFAGSLDNKGFLRISDEKLKGRHHLLLKFQHMSPLGVGARSSQEVLLLQIDPNTNPVAYAIIHNHYQDFIHQRISRIAKSMKRSTDQITHIIKHHIQPLNPWPLINEYQQPAPMIIPDITIEYENNKWTLTVNHSHLPSIEVDPVYTQLLNKGRSKDQDYIQMQRYISDGQWLEKIMLRRHSILYQLTKYLITIHGDYLKGSNVQTKPLLITDVAQQLAMNESTLSRAIKEKYLNTPIGNILLRTLFTSKIQTQTGEMSSIHVKLLIKQMIASEHKPFSDQNISTKLNQQGIQCSRRTVTKYRTLLRIPSTRYRKFLTSYSNTSDNSNS